jgi:acyl carrier protein
MTHELPASLAEHVARHEAALARVRSVLVTQLKVTLPPEQIELDAPLFGTGLGLDSVDAVELVVAIETEFGIHLPEGAAGPAQFRTVHSLVELVLHPPIAVAPAAPPPEGGAS